MEENSKDLIIILLSILVGFSTLDILTIRITMNSIWKNNNKNNIKILDYHFISGEINKIIVTAIEYNNKIYYYYDSEVFYYIFKDDKDKKIKLSKEELDYKLNLMLKFNNK